MFPTKSPSGGERQLIEILTGKPAGRWLPRRGYEPGTIHYLVDEGLRKVEAEDRGAENGDGAST